MDRRSDREQVHPDIRRSIDPPAENALSLILSGIVGRFIVGRGAFLVPTLPFLGFCFAHLDYFPIWDGLLYYNCALKGSQRSLNPFEYYCYYHPTIAYLWPIGILQRLAYGHYEWVIAFNAGLGLVAIALYAALARIVLPEPNARVERVLAVALLGSCPVFVSNALQLNPDYAVALAFLGVTLAFARDRLGVAVAWGFVSVLCKESGTLLYSIAAATYVLAFLVTSPLPRAEKWKWLVRRSPLLIVPAFSALCAFILYRGVGAAVFWGGGKDVLSATSLLDRLLVAMLGTIFVLNFMWLPSTVLVLGGLKRFAGLFRRSTHVNGGTPLPRDRVGLFLALLLVSAVVLLTRPRTVVNVRYYLPIYPLVLLLSVRALARLISSPLLRIFLLGVTLALILPSNVRSFDPVSRQLYSTIAFGRHPMYAITSITQECCGLGRDQLVYNLEFTQFHYLIEHILSDVLVDRQATLAMNPDGNWHIIETVDRRTLRRAAPSGATFQPVVLTFDALEKMPVKPARISYIELPNMDEATEQKRWATLYRLGPARTYERQGYTLQVRELVLK